MGPELVVGVNEKDLPLPVPLQGGKVREAGCRGGLSTSAMPPATKRDAAGSLT